MFSKFTLIFSLAVLAVATPTPQNSQCNTGSQFCCNNVQQANSPAASKALGLFGVVLQDISAPVGLDCSPLNIIGIGSNSCNSEAVCCSGNNFEGVVVIGCSPINIGL